MKNQCCRCGTQFRLVFYKNKLACIECEKDLSARDYGLIKLPK